jgi:RNA polymerase sigma factor (sigma-70 family)
MIIAAPLHMPAMRTQAQSAGTTEDEQLRAARRGDAAAFEALVRRHQTALFNFCVRLLGQSEDAADVAQETFVQLYSHLGRLDERDSLAPWLFRVARNRCLDVLRRRRTAPIGPFGRARGRPSPDVAGATPAAFDPADEQPLPDELAERADLQRLLGQAIAQLPPAYAEVVALRYAADRSFSEIAAILECDEGAARVRFHRAKALLRARLRHLAEEDEVP